MGEPIPPLGLVKKHLEEKEATSTPVAQPNLLARTEPCSTAVLALGSIFTLPYSEESQVQDTGAGQLGQHADSDVKSKPCEPLLHLPNTLDMLPPCRAGLLLMLHANPPVLRATATADVC